ncbi:hypothetical protein JYT28_00045 [Desulfobulbus sp. AH-315-M07]|nr:hypothetical protein [Desulfobulbus sp. AH-315-M07]
MSDDTESNPPESNEPKSKAPEHTGKETPEYMSVAFIGVMLVTLLGGGWLMLDVILVRMDSLESLTLSQCGARIVYRDARPAKQRPKKAAKEEPKEAAPTVAASAAPAASGSAAPATEPATDKPAGDAPAPAPAPAPANP